jgi:ubiquinone/menaquinone biosynthesis C-methylase UbiE
MPGDILEEQLQYYRARAPEYDASVALFRRFGGGHSPDEEREWGEAVQALHALGPCGRALELAGGTGLWTRELTRIAAEITVLDGSPEMLALNRATVGDPRVRYECVDLFSWEPDREFDLVFFAFWLSHVPPDRIDRFLDRLARAIAPGGRVFLVDEPRGGREISGPSFEGLYQERTLSDGRTFRIVKVYHDPEDIQRRLALRGLGPVELHVGECYFRLISARPPSEEGPIHRAQS